ncbi:MAG: acyl-CoA thioesterase [Elusimicrobia bacterium RIFOXYA2_FULL_39_19]|nr:MAG: acyl-CoA thioesterase [Elusimicrobia bacterium RIFOXYA2_FULL_39_19]
MLELKIYYEDTDAGGIVYYANYLKYFERARTEMFESRGFSVAELAKKDVLFVVAHAELDYKSSAVLGDILQVETKISELSKVSFWVDYTVKRKTDSSVVVTGRTKMACVSGSLKIQKIPQEIAETLSK